MPQVPNSDIGATVAAFLDKIGFELHKEHIGDQLMTRIQLNKKFAAAPTDMFQSVGANALFNFPDVVDNALDAGAGLLRGNSPSPPPPLGN